MNDEIEKLIVEIEQRTANIPEIRPREGRVVISVEPRTIAELYVAVVKVERLCAALRVAVECVKVHAWLEGERAEHFKKVTNGRVLAALRGETETEDAN